MLIVSRAAGLVLRTPPSVDEAGLCPPLLAAQGQTVLHPAAPIRPSERIPALRNAVQGVGGRGCEGATAAG
jgi:hypothetical protein